MQSQRETEADFEQRWNSLKPNTNSRQPAINNLAFPILEHFNGDELGRELDEVLTVMETSQGLSFEYVWEATKEDHFEEHSHPDSDAIVNYNSLFFPVPVDVFPKSVSELGPGKPDLANREEASPVQEVVPVFDSHSASVTNEYYIRLEEQGDGKLDFDSCSDHKEWREENLQFIALNDLGNAGASKNNNCSAVSDKSSVPKYLYVSGRPDFSLHKTVNNVHLSDNRSIDLALSDLTKQNDGHDHKSSLTGSKTNILTKGGQNVFDTNTLLLDSISDPNLALDLEQLSDNFIFLQEKNLLSDHPKLLPSNVGSKNIFEHASNLVIELTLAELDTSFLNFSGEVLTGKTENAQLTDLAQLGLIDQLGSTTAHDEFLQELPTEPRLSGKELDSTASDKLRDPAENFAKIDTRRPLTDAESIDLYRSFDHVSTDEVHDDVIFNDQVCSEPVSSIKAKKSGEHVNGDLHIAFLAKTSASVDSTSQDSLLDDSASNCTQSLVPSVGTPDSLDVQNILESDESHKFVPSDKPADSGYETENLESPEWTSHVVNGSSSHSVPSSEVSSSIAPVIILSEVGQNNLEENNAELDDKSLKSTNGGNNSYRDSAYFSDNDSESEKKLDVAEIKAIENESTSEEREGSEETTRSFPRKVLVPGKWVSNLSLSSDHSEQTLPVPSVDDSTSENDEEIVNPFGPSEVFCSVNSIKEMPFLSHTEGQKLKEPDMEGKYLGKLDASGLLDLSEDGMDADKEDENSDDSEAFNLHSFSSDREDDTIHPVPVVHMETDDRKNLKSLIKARTPTSDKQEKKSRKVVSFFDNVTIYLFDQETPTKELGSRAVDASNQMSSNSSPVSPPAPGYRFANSESSTDEEGGGFEWDDDFTSPEPAFISKPVTNQVGAKLSVNPSKYFSPPLPPRSPDQSWTHAPAPFYSRFSISPANMANFSLTHLTDSDIEQGGNSRDGPKE
ncbi:Serine threonine-protein kinase LMTK2, partial [Pristimantis euphronides]